MPDNRQQKVKRSESVLHRTWLEVEDYINVGMLGDQTVEWVIADIRDEDMFPRPGVMEAGLVAYFVTLEGERIHAGLPLNSNKRKVLALGTGAQISAAKGLKVKLSKAQKTDSQGRKVGDPYIQLQVVGRVESAKPAAPRPPAPSTGRPPAIATTQHPASAPAALAAGVGKTVDELIAATKPPTEKTE